MKFTLTRAFSSLDAYNQMQQYKFFVLCCFFAILTSCSLTTNSCTREEHAKCNVL